MNNDVARIMLVIFAGLYSLPALAYRMPRTVTVQEFLDQIEQSSPRLAQAKVDLAAIKSEYYSARAVPNPEAFLSEERLEYPSGNEYERTIGVSQDISFLWSAPQIVRTHAARFDAAAARYRGIRASIQFDALNLLLRRNALKQQIELATDISSRLAQVSAQMEARAKLGDVSSYDGERFRRAMLKFAGTRAELREKESEAVLELMELTGLDTASIAKIEPDERPLLLPFKSIEEALAYSAEHSFSLRSAQFESVAAQRNVSAHRWAMVPDVSLALGRKEVGGGITGPTIEAQIELPLLNQGRSSLSLAAAEQHQADLAFSSRKNEVRQSIEDAWSQLELVEADLKMFAEKPSDFGAEQALQLYSFGEISALETIDMLQATLETANAHAELGIRRNVLVKRIVIACGYDLFAQ